MRRTQTQKGAGPGGAHPQGEIRVDPSGKKSGRGAYLCPNPECLKKARRAKRLERALDCPIPEEVYDRLEEEMRDGPHDG